MGFEPMRAKGPLASQSLSDLEASVSLSAIQRPTWLGDPGTGSARPWTRSKASSSGPVTSAKAFIRPENDACTFA